MFGMLGTIPLATTTLAASLYEPVYAPSIDVLIDSVDRSSLYQPGSMRVTDKINDANTARLALIDESRTYFPAEGQEIEIKRLGHRLFRGRISAISIRTPMVEAFNEIQISAQDFNKLTDRFVLAAAYETPGQTLRDIVLDIVNTQNAGALASEGVTTTNVAEGPEIEIAKFNYDTVRKAFDELADRTGYLWNIDYNKDLHFFDRETFAAPYDFGVGGVNRFNSIDKRSTLSEYRNVEYLRGGREVSELITERYKGDGEMKSFPLALDVANEDGDPPLVEVNAVSKTVGVRSKDGDTDYDWFWNRGDKTLTQSFAGTTLTASDTLEVVYRGFIDVIVLGEKRSEIDNRIAIEGGTGIYSHVENDQSIDEFSLAVDKTQELLRRYGVVPEIVRIETFHQRMESGMLPFIEHAGLGISGRYMIESVTTRDGKGGLIVQSIEALNTESRGGWADWFRRLINKVGPVTIRENEKLALVRTTDEHLTVSDSVSVDPDHGGVFIINDPFTGQYIGKRTVSGEQIAGWVIGFAAIGDHPLRAYAS